MGVVTPVPNSWPGRWSRASVHEVVVKDRDIARFVPDPPGGLIGFDRAVELALQKIQDADVATRWASASDPRRAKRPDAERPRLGRRQPLRRRPRVARRGEPRLAVVGRRQHRRDNGWYSWALAWQVRGWMDVFSGGPGLPPRAP